MKTEKEERISAIIEFATRLQVRLDSNISDPAMLAELSQHLVKTFPKPPTSLIAKLDTLGRGLWNTTIQMQQRDFQIPGFSSQLRAFAFFVIDIAYQALAKHNPDRGENLVRILRIALKAGRACVNDQLMDLANRIFERAAVFVQHIDKENGPEFDQQDEVKPALQDLSAEYCLLRATMSWKTGRFDLVDFWLPKMLIHSETDKSVGLIEKKADFLYEVGKAELKIKNHAGAAGWLEKSLDTIEAIDQVDFSPDCGELRLAIMGDLAQALIGIKDASSLSKAFDVVTRMGYELPEFSMSTSLLRLECLFADTPVDVEQVFNVLLHVMESIHMIDSNITTVVHQIHRLKKANEVNQKADSHSVSYACQALESLLPRLYNLGNQDWIEKVLITRLWLGVTEQQNLACAKALEDLLHAVYSTTGRPLSLEATHAAQSLLWKLIDVPLGTQPEGDSDTWCRLACHALFQNAGDLNKSKLSRKMMLNALAQGDADAARGIYFAMPDSGKVAPMTNYIMYKLALRCDDPDLASTSLDGVLKASAKDTTFLYACTLEAQQSGNRQQAIAALQKVLEYHNRGAPKGIYLPALLRATAKMIMLDIDAKSVPLPTALLEVCRLFEAAMSQANSFRVLESGEVNDKFSAELRWFASNSYNLTLAHLADMQPELVVRFMTVCVSFVDMLRSEGTWDDGIMYRLLLCRFIAASALVVLGRTEDNVERSLSHYLDARRQIEAFRKCAIDINHFEGNTKASLGVKDFELLKYDLEALLKLQHWNDLDRVLGLCLAQQHSDRWGTIADLMIHIHSHIFSENLDKHYLTKIPMVMEKIINASWKQSGKDVHNFARWTRCLFQMTLHLDPTMAMQCVKSARMVALAAKADHAPKRYPKEELAWLSTSAFNHAVDTFCAGDRENGHLWAETALNLAMVAGKGTGLHESLQAKWIGMQAKVDK